MKSSSGKFLKAAFVTTLICVVLQIIWNYYAPVNYVTETGFFLLGFFSLSVTGIHFFLISAAKGDQKAFIGKYMASTVFKFMFYLMLLVVLLLFSTENKVALILHFLFYYAVFTVLEVAFLYNELSKLKK